MQLPNWPDPDYDEHRLKNLDLMHWFGDQRVVQVAAVMFCVLIAVVWSTTRHSKIQGPLVSADDAPNLAGEPSPSILAAAREATPSASPPTVPVDAEPDPSTSPTLGDTTVSGDTTAGPAEPSGDVTPDTTAPVVVVPPSNRPTRVFPINQAERLSTGQLVAMVESNNITNVADFLSALPPFMGESYTLMEESRSRHQASVDYPRLIMYGPDARILIGVSSHPADPLREVVEVAELDETTGLWRFSQFDFTNAFFHDTNTESCAGCHGSPQRPIWGEYPNWPGAFAGQDERLAGSQAATLMNLKADPLDRFHHLVFPSDHSIQNNGQFYLPTRDYGYANTSFNFELNAAVADGIARRIINHPNWDAEGYRLLAAQWDCNRNNDPSQIDAVYNRFGIDGNNDFQLESPVFEAQAGQGDEYDWNQGSTGLDNSVAFRTLDLASQQDPELEAIVSADQRFVDFSNYWFNILGAPRSIFLETNGIYETDFRPQNLGGGFVAQVCNYLGTKGA